jgi:glycosyltransferase involved in cell wall biosynthesis
VGEQECVVPYFSIFDIGINCSKNEGLSNAIMEYMAYGVASIVSEAGGNTELIKNEINGLTFELGNHEQLSSRIITLLNKPLLRRKFILKSKEYVANHLQIDKVIDQYDNYFKSLLGYTSAPVQAR